MASDVARHLENQPVLAGPPTKVYRLEKFLRRHKTGVAAAALIVLAMAVGTTAAAVGLVRAKRAEALARQEALRAGREAETSQRISAFLVSLFEISDPDQTRGSTITAREVLDTGAEKTANELKGQPAVQAALLEAMGRAYVSLGLFDRAEPLLRQALNLRRKTF